MHGVRQILIHPDYKPSDSSHPGNNDIGMAIFILLFTSLSFFATYLLLRGEFYPPQFPLGRHVML